MHAPPTEIAVTDWNVGWAERSLWDQFGEAAAVVFISCISML